MNKPDKKALDKIDACLPKVTEKQNIGLLGGSFDPPHLGHQLFALSSLSLLDIKKLWIIPCANHPFQKNLSSYESRMKICRLAFNKIKNVSVLEIERYLSQPNFTINTIAAIKDLRPNVTIYLIIGSDNLKNIEKWHKIRQIEELSKIMVFSRKGFLVKNGEKNIHNLQQNLILPDIQSSKIKKDLQRVATGRQRRHCLVDNEVLRFINRHNLYQ